MEPSIIGFGSNVSHLIDPENIVFSLAEGLGRVGRRLLVILSNAWQFRNFGGRFLATSGQFEGDLVTRRSLGAAEDFAITARQVGV